MEQDSKAVENYINYVQDKINQIKDTSDLIEDLHILPQRLNYALANYIDVHLGLQAEYQRLIKEKKKLEKSFNMWWDEKFVETRDALRVTRSASSSLSVKEIESQLRVDNKKSYMEKTEEIEDLQEQTDFIKTLIDIWNKEDKILVTLSNNMRTEMISLSVEDRANRRPVSKKAKRRLVDD